MLSGHASGHSRHAGPLTASGATAALTAPPPSGQQGPADPRLAELTGRIVAGDPKADTSLVEAAYALAARAHEKQRRENGDPYITHPLAVAEILVGYRLDTGSIITGLLHDVIEDTPVTLAEIEKAFGKETARLVDGVTKLTRLELQSDRTKQAENFRKLVLAMSKDIRVLLVKLADRLHNMRTLHFVVEPEKRKRIARETMEIYAPLAERIGMDALKTELQSLAFAQLHPEAWQTITARLNFLRGQGADLVKEVRRELREACESAGIPVVEVTGREKSPYSIWEKMQRRNVTFEQLSDIMAFRLIVPTKEACYAALGAVHSAYPVIAGRFKDYISTPKSNGYQSLHTGVTLREPRNQKIEIQIRTREMHMIADYGVAAHWAYKTGAEAEANGRDFAWVQDLLEILENSGAPDEFLENTKLELYQDQVFCFTPAGKLIPLPRGATPVDFAYAVHSQVGDTCVGVKVNGRIMPLRTELQNGDQVEIITARGHTPSPQWERFVVTGKARARIRRFVLARQRQSYMDQGRSMLAKAFRQEGVDGSEKIIESTLKGLKFATLDELYLAVGNQNVGARDVVHAAYPELRTQRAPRVVPQLGRVTPADRVGDSERGNGVPITGLVPGMAIQFAGCCHALPGDRIVGIVTTGKGVTIHTRDCATLENFAATPERFIDVDWDYAAASRDRGGHLGRISVIANAGGGALANVATAIARHEGTVSSIRVVNRQQDFFEVLVDVEVRDVRHLSHLIAALRATAGITQVERAKA